MKIESLNVPFNPSIGNLYDYDECDYILLNNKNKISLISNCREELWNYFKNNNSVAVIAIEKYFSVNYAQFEKNIDYFFELYGGKKPKIKPIKMVCGKQSKLCFLIKSLPKEKDIVKLSALIARLSICQQAFKIHPVTFFKHRFFIEKNEDLDNWEEEIPKGKKLIFSEKMKKSSKILAELALSEISNEDLKEIRKSISNIKIIDSDIKS